MVGATAGIWMPGAVSAMDCALMAGKSGPPRGQLTTRVDDSLQRRLALTGVDLAGMIGRRRNRAG